MSEHLSIVHQKCFNLCSTFWVFYISFCLWEWHFLSFPLDIVGVLCLTALKTYYPHNWLLWFECHDWEDEADKYRISICFSVRSLESLNLVAVAGSRLFVKHFLCFSSRLHWHMKETATGRAPRQSFYNPPYSLPFLGIPIPCLSGILGEGREQKNNLSSEIK